MDYAWTCQCCGKQYSTLPLDFACQVPDYWLGMEEAERETRGKLSSEVCFADEHIFVRGCIEIPVIGTDDKFVWGAWVSLSQRSYARYCELWDAQVVEDEPPLFGWLCNELSPYPATLSLKTNVHLRGRNMRPAIELEPTDHPLAIEQRQGIPLARVEELAGMLLRHS